MDVVVLDFETYYDHGYSLTKRTTEEYIHDIQFEVIGFAYKRNDEPTVWVDGRDEDQIAVALDAIDWANTALIAHNAAFDAAILSFRFNIYPKIIIDTLSMGRAMRGVDESVSLANMALHYGVGTKGTEVLDARGRHIVDFNNAELAAYGAYCANDVELTHKLFHRMMADGFPKAELKLVDMTIRMFTRPLLELDIDMLNAHLVEVKEAKRMHLINTLQAVGRDDLAAVAIVGGTEHEHIQKALRSSAQFASMLEGLGVTAPTKISPTTGKPTFAFAKTDEAFRALLEHDDVRVQTVCAARLGLKSTLEETRTERFIGMGKRGKLAIPLRYAGARTYRWSGADSVNLQNLPRKSKIKQAIRAPEGFTIVGADLSNIELRVGLWLAGQMDKLKALGEGRDLYKDFASSVFGVPYDEVTDDQRFIGKTSQLSLIYGVGAKKLRAAIKSGSKVDIGEAESQRIVDLYRQEYAHVKAAWDHGERALTAVHQNKQMAYGRRGLVQVLGESGVLLPSGLILRYPMLCHITVDAKTNWAYTTRKGQEFIYGAKFFQGVVQSLARCVIGESMIRIDKNYPTLLTIHDADYILAPDAEVEAAKAFVYTEMCKAPKWMPDIPLNAQVKFGKTLADC
jgi:DNA polymerase